MWGPNPSQNNTQPMLTSLSCSQHWCSQNLPIQRPPGAGHRQSITRSWDFTLQIQSEGGKEGSYRTELDNGVWVGLHYSPVHLTPLNLSLQFLSNPLLCSCRATHLSLSKPAALLMAFPEHTLLPPQQPIPWDSLNTEYTFRFLFYFSSKKPRHFAT